MRLVVVTPVGPGHEEAVWRCIASVEKLALGPFSSILHEIVYDLSGELGRGRARNIGMVDADWYFFVDADDAAYPDATSHINMNYTATFGSVILRGHRARHDVYPCGWKEIFEHGARGTLSMGMFVKGDVARELRFNEKMEVGEDFDFYMRLPDFIKVPQSLVDIDYPKGKGLKSDWCGECRKVIDSYVGSAAR